MKEWDFWVREYNLNPNSVLPNCPLERQYHLTLAKGIFHSQYLVSYGFLIFAALLGAKWYPIGTLLCVFNCIITKVKHLFIYLFCSYTYTLLLGNCTSWFAWDN